MFKLRNSNTNTAICRKYFCGHSSFNVYDRSPRKWENVIILFHASAGPLHNFLNAKLL